MPKILSLASVLVLPTRYGEGVPKIIIEACASGVPVVTSKIPGCAEIIENGVNGYMANVKNSTELTDCVKMLLEDPELIENLGLNARAIAKNWSVDIVVSKTLEIYRMMTADKAL